MRARWRCHGAEDTLFGMDAETVRAMLLRNLVAMDLEETLRVWEHRPSTLTHVGVPKDDIAFMAHAADLVVGALGD